MEEQKSHNQLLDNTLAFFNSISNQIGSPFIVRTLKPKLNVTDLKIWHIVNHLIKEGYLEKTKATTGNADFYTITLNGSLFIENGGYQKQQEDAELNKTIICQNEMRKVRNDRLLVNGTWFAGIAAFALLAWQVFLWFYPVYAHYPYVLFGVKP